MDIASTILDLAGVDVPEHHQGESFVPLLRDPDADWRDDLMCEFFGLRIAYYQRMLRWRHYKYVYNAADWDELYDLDADPHEMNNRIDDPALREVADECRQRLLRNIKESGDVVLGTAWQHLNFAYDGATSPCVPAKSDTGTGGSH
jgi:arylsulfatase A-like enzyme